MKGARATKRFRRDFYGLSDSDKVAVNDAVEAFATHFGDPPEDLRVHELEGHPGVISITAGWDLRVTLMIDDGVLVLRRAGSHSVYNEP